MPYISKEFVKDVRNEIRRRYPEWRFSITRGNYNTIRVSILSGPIEMISDPSNTSKYEQVNHYFIEKNYSGDVKDILLDIYKIVNRKNGIECEDVDYGLIPYYFVNIEIGKWDRPYKVVN